MDPGAQFGAARPWPIRPCGCYWPRGSPATTRRCRARRSPLRCRCCRQRRGSWPKLTLEKWWNMVGETGETWEIWWNWWNMGNMVKYGETGETWEIWWNMAKLGSYPIWDDDSARVGVRGREDASTNSGSLRNKHCVCNNNWSNWLITPVQGPYLLR